MSRESGEGKFGCFVTLVLLLVFGLICFRTVPVMMDKLDFEDQIDRLISEAGARGWDVEAIRVQVYDLLKNKQFEAPPEDVKILRNSGRGGDIRIIVKYSRQVDYLGYTHTFRFEKDAKSFVGTL